MPKAKVFFAVMFALHLIYPSAIASSPSPRPKPSLPSELNGSGIPVTALRELLYEPLYINGTNSGTHSHLEVGTAFVGGQDAINTQISHVSTAQTENNQNTKVCEGYFDAGCAGELKSATIILPVCSDDETSACIESLLLKNSGNFVAGTKIGYVNNEYSDSAKLAKYAGLESSNDAFWDTIKTTDVQSEETWAGDPSKKLPRASSPSKWQVSGINNAALTDTYLVNARITFNYLDNEPLYFSNFTTEVIPYKEIRGSNFVPPFFVTRNVFASKADRDSNSNRLSTETFPSSPRYPLASYDNPDQGQHLTCAYEEIDELTPANSTCGAAVRFADNTEVKISLRIPNDLGGWFHGRLSNTDVSITSFNSYLNNLLITAKPVDVPISSYQFEGCDPSKQEFSTKYFPTAVENPNFNQTQFCARSDRDGLGSWGQWSPNSLNAVSEFTNYEDLLDSRAKGLVNTWSIGSIPSYYFEESNSCFSNTSEVQGFISTNAMVYQAGIPIYSNRKFNYQIASTHRDAEADVIKGDYTLKIRSSVARCIWGLGNRNLNAVIKVKGATNSEKTAQTTFNESDGWIRLTVRDFTFSESNIELELSEEPANISAVNPAAGGTTSSSSTASSGNSVSGSVALTATNRISQNTLAGQLGLSPSSKATVSVSISKNSKKYCKVVGKNVVAIKAGSCNVTVTVQEPKPRQVKALGTIRMDESTRLSKQQLVERSGRTFVPKSTVTIRVDSKSRKACTVRSGKLVVKPGADCSYSILINEPRPKAVKTSGTIQVN